MDNYEESLQDLKIKLYRLHFLLTEKQTEESVKETMQHFAVCFKQAFDCMAMYFKNDHNLTLSSSTEIIDVSFEKQLFNQQTIDLLHKMEQDYEEIKASKNSGQIVNTIADSYARLLQMIYDMLASMGKDPLDDENE